MWFIKNVIPSRDLILLYVSHPIFWQTRVMKSPGVAQGGLARLRGRVRRGAHCAVRSFIHSCVLPFAIVFCILCSDSAKFRQNCFLIYSKNCFLNVTLIKISEKLRKFNSEKSGVHLTTCFCKHLLPLMKMRGDYAENNKSGAIADVAFSFSVVSWYTLKRVAKTKLKNLVREKSKSWKLAKAGMM